MIDYMLAHYGTSNEWALMKIDENDEGCVDSIEWLTRAGEWTKDKEYARRFYYQEEAEGFLALYKIRGKKQKDV